MAKRKRKRRSSGTLLIIAIALLIAGFIVRRTMLPQFLHYLAYRPANPPSHVSESPAPEETSASPSSGEPSGAQRAAAPAVTPMARQSAGPPGEHLTQGDRQQLEDILKRKSR